MGVKFPGIKYNNHRLEMDGVDLEALAEKVSTPYYVYSADQIVDHYTEMHQAFGDRPHLICYAVKANPNIAILRILSELGSGAEIVSGGELFRALEAEVSPEKIIFDGVGKTREEIDYAIRKKILFFNVESEQELLTIDLVAKEHKKLVNVSFRVNPDVNPKTHPHISTGLRRSKFGIPIRKAPDLIKTALRLKNVHVMGLGCHIGSQIIQISPYQEAVRRLVQLYDQVSQWTNQITHLNLGGGLGITYKSERPPSIQHWVNTICKEIGDRPVTMVVEPGRCLVGNAGILVTKVLYVKRGEADNFIISDTGMNDLLRPALYDAQHLVLPVRYKRYKKIKASLVGPVCETADTLAKDRRIQNFQQGDLMAIMSCGAYAASMGSQYNSRTRPPEILVQDGRYFVIRERESYEDLIHLERLPVGLKKNTTAVSVAHL